MLSLLNNNSKTGQQVSNPDFLTEKKNLINICKLVIKDLINSSLKSEDNLIDFFTVIENIINHGFIGRKSGYYFNFQVKKDFSALLDIVETKFDSNNNMKNLKEMTDIKTSLGRVRAWVRMLLMQKCLAENFAFLIQEKKLLTEIYEPNSLLVSEEAVIINGLLIGLNALDFSIDLRSIINELDSPLKTINYSSYLREKIPGQEETESNSGDSNDTKYWEIFDQKNFLEEINNKQKAQIEVLQKKIYDEEKLYKETQDEINLMKKENMELKEKNDEFIKEREKLETEFKVKYEALYQDILVERETFLASKSGLDQMYIELQKKIIEESKLRLNFETELQTQKTLKEELEMAIKLMDASLEDDKKTINRLREQLEQVKVMNLDTNNKNQALKIQLDEELDKNLKLNKDNLILNEKINLLEKNLSEKTKICLSYQEDLIISKEKISVLETDLSIEKTWRINLKTELESLKKTYETMNEESKKLEELKYEYDSMKCELEDLRNINADLEKTLEEMGSKLGSSHLRMDNFKEVTKVLNEYQWEPNESVKICKICTKEFNVARRKHHCRRCGGIFCGDCSENKMPLPSSAKPVRVCNNCYGTVLQNCLATK